MKNLRQLCVAGVLALTLSTPAFAGVMSTTVAPPQPATGATVAGEMSTTATADDADAENEEASVVVSATETMLNVLQSVLSLL